MQSRLIPDSAITASSERINYLRASRARLHMHSFYPWLPAGWSAAVSDHKQWLEINLELKTIVTGIGTQGLSSRWSPDQWVTSYQVSHRDKADEKWVHYQQQGHIKVFVKSGQTVSSIGWCDTKSVARKRELIALGGGVITDLVLAINGNETGGGVGWDGFGYKLSFTFISLYVVLRTRRECFFQFCLYDRSLQTWSFQRFEEGWELKWEKI